MTLFVQCRNPLELETFILHSIEQERESEREKQREAKRKKNYFSMKTFWFNILNVKF